MKTSILIILGLIIAPTAIFCQSFNSPVEYMNYMSDQYKSINKDTWDYTSAVAHGKSARKVDKKRKEVLKTLEKAKSSIKKIKGYNGDNALRDSVISYLSISYDVLNHDYAKIVDMEAISEQSFDAMEAYMMAQDKATERLSDAGKMLQIQQHAYARSHDITINSEMDEISRKLEAANEVFDYYREIYLIFFKSYKQEAYIIDAMGRNDVNSIEQNKNSLITFANEGLEKLKPIKGFKGDVTIKTTCKNMLLFYKKEAEEDVNVITDFYLTNENFTKVKAAFDAKKESKRTQADVDEFNKAVNDVNAASNNFNELNNKLNKSRGDLLNKWNDSVTKFLDKHVSK